MREPPSAAVDLYEYAKQALDLGLVVIPPAEDQSKRPDGGLDWPNRVVTDDDLRRWYLREQRTGFGIVTGERSMGLELFEFEGRACPEIYDRFLARAREVGLGGDVDDIRGGYEEVTPSGGVHWLYLVEHASSENGALAKRPTDDGIRPLIEVKTTGGYTILSPSAGPNIHPSGKSWVLRNGSLTSVVQITPELRNRLHALAMEFDEMPSPPPRVKKPKPARRPGEVSPLDDFDDRADWAADVLEPAGWTYVWQTGQTEHWRRPGKTYGHSATVNYDGNDRLCVFSSSTPFRVHERGNGDTTYGKARAYAVLFHGGNLSATAKDLAASGYGSHPAAEFSATTSMTGERPVPLTDEFWRSRLALAQIRQAARARLVSPTAVLHVVLARLAAMVPHTIKLPPIVGTAVPLCYFVALIARPGVGKSSANGVGAELLPAPPPDELNVADQLPLGSGEGLVDALFGLVPEEDESGKPKKVKRQVRWNAFIYADEGEVLDSLTGRSGSTLGPVMRTIFTGGTLGQTNASEDRKRVVPAGQYTYGVVCGFQDVLAGALLHDADGGTPQRFAWARADDPDIPDVAPPWPGPLDWKRPTAMRLFEIEQNGSYTRHPLGVAHEIVGEIQALHRAKMRGDLNVDPLDAHRTLLRLKVAGLLALLDQRLDITTDDWSLADLTLADSDQTRTHVVGTVRAADERKERATSARYARRQAEADSAVETRRTVDTARNLAAKVWTSEDETTKRDLRNRATKTQRPYFDAGLDHAIAERWLVIRNETTQGRERFIVERGDRRPT